MQNQSQAQYQDIIQFWFHELKPDNWFEKDLALDKKIKDKFQKTHEQAAKGELFAWRTAPEGRLAEIIVLDQFSRNMFRDDKKCFEFDTIALILAQEAVAVKADAEFTPQQKSFMYMPYMHSESLKIHDEALRLFNQKGLEYNFEFEKKHRAIIERFGRYPHRNKILGRSSTPEEIEFLKTPGSSF